MDRGGPYLLGCVKKHFFQFETPGELSLGMDYLHPKILVKSEHVSPGKRFPYNPYADST